MNPSVLAAQPVVLPTPDLYAPIASDLEEMERVLARTIKSRFSAVAAVVDHIRHYRGKRLRPVLLLLTARASGKLTPAHPILGAVVEMIHTATLVHDDVLDNAGVRRHVETVNARWGNQTSVLLGDYLFTHALHLASTLDDPRAIRLIAAATNRLCEGEMCQGLQEGNLDLTEADYFEIIDGKTAELLSCCCQLGALFGGAREEVVQAMTRFGRSLGLAFQIADDLLDLVGDETRVGKSLGTDVAQQKMTLPLITLLQHTDANLTARARTALAGPAEDRLPILRGLLHQSGALDQARRQAEDLAARARRELALLPASPARLALEIACHGVVHRTH
jgi:octaprenyl-diphosphate synthase